MFREHDAQVGRVATAEVGTSETWAQRRRDATGV
jgi:hypothetical protein